MEYIITVVDNINMGGEETKKTRNFQVIESRSIAKEEKQAKIYRGSWIDEERTPYGQDFIEIDENNNLEKLNKIEGLKMFKLKKGS
jgi:Rps23 Pro-64 3,4-dihydroxylase Tpa1-like proline 4-hydroxylase